MMQRVLRHATAGAAIAALVLFSSSASAGSWGSSGGSSGGSWGSHGSHGSWGSYGSHGSYGSYGSYGSHGSWGSHGSSGGSWGSYGSYGSHGSYGYSYSARSYGGYAANTATTSQKATLNVQVPENAVVLVNGHRTTSTGTSRRYTTPALDASQTYSFVIKAQLEQDGATLEETKTVRLTAGGSRSVSFNLRPQGPETMLSLSVPAEAEVTLAGVPTSQTGTARLFKTRAIPSGQSWDQYTVRVTLDHNGRQLTQERSITLKAGERHALSFDFDAAKVAAAR